MPTRCHVCGTLTRKPLDVPVCGDPHTRIKVCSKRCRDEYLAGYVETRKGRTFRLLLRASGPGLVLAALWAGYALVHLFGPLLDRALPLPLLPSPRGPEFYSAGVAALVVAFAVLREVRLARWFSVGLAGLGLLFAVLAFARSGDRGWLLELLAVYPPLLLLSLGEPGPKRAVGALGLFGVYPAALVATALLTGSLVSDEARRAASESYAERSVAHPARRLALTAPDGWFILKPESELLPRGDELFRAVHPDARLSATVREIDRCDPYAGENFDAVRRRLAVNGVDASYDGDPRPGPVASDLGRGYSAFLRRDRPKPELWYLVFLPWRTDRCLELRCGGSELEADRIRTDCVRLGARGLSRL